MITICQLLCTIFKSKFNLINVVRYLWTQNLFKYQVSCFLKKNQKYWVNAPFHDQIKALIVVVRIIFWRNVLSVQGVVKESDLESFNLPYYNPDESEVKEVIDNEGSFEINNFETIFGLLFSYKTGRSEVKDDSDDDVDHSRRFEVVKKRANLARSIIEPMLVAHFGDAIIDRLFEKYIYHAGRRYDTLRNKPTVNFFVSLTRK